MRKPLQGTRNIVRFNRHFYLPAAVAAGALGLAWACLPGGAGRGAGVLLALTALPVLVSLAAAAWIYDLSGLYRFDWLRRCAVSPVGPVVNIHAGFDETSAALRQEYPDAPLTVLDFYDPARHTERSLRVARRAYPPYPGTLAVDPRALPVADHSAAAVFVLFAAHEIRDDAERAAFFRETARILAPGGRIVVLEHFRDAANFLVWNFGAFHFLPESAWRRTFRAAGLRVVRQERITPFLRLLELQPSHDDDDHD